MMPHTVTMLCNRKLVFWLVLIAVLSTTAHLLYSPYGFNPSDEGYMLSGSRRLLDGQIPHRDYISLRPVATHYIHAHFLLWAGDSLMWWGRYVAWVQLAVVAALWVLITEKEFGRTLPVSSRIAAALIGFALSAHTFPVMPWNTIDAVFLVTIGVFLMQGGGRWGLVGALLAGIAPLCRQSLIVFVPFLCLIASDRRRLLNVAAGFIPSLFYGLFLIYHGALADALGQMTGAEFHWMYFVPFAADRSVFATMLITGVSASIAGWHLTARKPIPPNMSKPKRSIRLESIAVAVFITMAALHSNEGTKWYSWTLFGAIIGFGIAGSIPGRLAAMGLLLSWSAAFSVGYPSPSLASAALAAPQIAVAFQNAGNREGGSRILIGLAIIVSVVFHFERTAKVYMQPGARYLTYHVGDALYGGKGIFTDRRTYALLSEMKHYVDTAQRIGAPYVVIPESAQFWATSPQPNLLSSDWCIDGELVNPHLKNRLLAEIDSCESGTVFLVQKYESWHISKDPRLWVVRPSILGDRIASKWPLVAETVYWRVYGRID